MLRSRLAQHGLRMLDAVGAGDCFFLNVRSAGVQYMRNDPEKFMESSTDQSWLKYLACMSQKCADKIVIQAVADA